MQTRRMKYPITFCTIRISGLANCEHFDLFKQRTTPNFNISDMTKKQTPQVLNVANVNQALIDPTLTQVHSVKWSNNQYRAINP